MKTAVITGASGALGKAIAEKFLENDYFTVGQYNTGRDRIEKFGNLLKNIGKSDYFFPFCADFSCADGANALADFTLENFGHADALVLNAGADLYKLCTDTEAAEWDRLFDINVKSAFLLVKRLLPSMLERKRGKIVFVSSIWGINGACMESAYSATKAALIGFCKSLAKEVAPSGVTVNCVCPGVIDTPMNDRFSAEEKAELIAKTPLNRFGTPREIAELIAFLCEKADFITGQTITADGGFTL